ncbi:hypothetical protein E2A64_05580 [Pseudohoeflea suaedae]|uniref:Phage tail tape measure protein n=1 Tax=Pseudohoeflea suaedae TaxID=877384 RepID=A0A4R5PNE7_9HYPH|nr:hypothetical protein [Pseudohoeflea suaedae]TDH38572.1 hypothetical protein E2A64_05580 [Pseudohoeflea suaedae]
MTSAVIGALRVTLGADTAAFSQGLSKAEMRMQKFASAAKAGALAAVGALAGLTAALGASIFKTASLADETLKAAQSLGLTTEELSKMKHAADMSGASFETLSTGLRKFSQGIADVAAGAKSGATEAFQSLGISVRNAQGQLKPTGDLMLEVADKLSRLQDGAAKTDLAMALFGRSGAALIPMLNSGAEGMRNMYAEAERLGIVIDTQTAKASERFNDNLARLQKTFSGVVVQIGEALIPYMADLSDLLVSMQTDASNLKSAFEPVIMTLKHLAAGVVRVGAAFKGVAMDITAATKAAFYFQTGNYVKGAKELFSGLSETQRYLDGVEETIAKIYSFGTGSGSIRQATTDRVRQVFDGARLGDVPQQMEVFWGGLLDETEEAVQKVKKVAGDGGRSAAAAFKEGANSAVDAWAGLRTVTEQTFEGMQRFGEGVGQSLRGLIDGTKKWKDVLADVLMSLAQIALSKVSFGGGAGGSLLSGIFSGLFGSMPRFANGGAMVIGGTI